MTDSRRVVEGGSDLSELALEQVVDLTGVVVDRRDDPERGIGRPRSMGSR